MPHKQTSMREEIAAYHVADGRAAPLIAKPVHPNTEPPPPPPRGFLRVSNTQETTCLMLLGAQHDHSHHVLQMSSQMHQADKTEKQLALRHDQRGYSRATFSFSSLVHL